VKGAAKTQFVDNNQRQILPTTLPVMLTPIGSSPKKTSVADNLLDLLAGSELTNRGRRKKRACLPTSGSIAVDHGEMLRPQGVTSCVMRLQ